MSKGYVVVLKAPDGSERELGPDDVIAPNLPADHSVTNEWSFETPYDPSLESFRHGEALVYFEREDGTRDLHSRGPIDAIKSSDDSKTQIRGNDTLEYLRRDGPDGVFVADGEAADEIERAWLQTDFNANVIKPQPELIEEGRVVQDGDLTTVFSNLPSTAPFVVSSGEVRPAQTCFLQECDGGANFLVERDDFSNGEGRVNLAEGQGTRDLDFTLDYDIPDGELNFFLRGERVDDQDPLFLSYEVFIDGSKVGEISVFTNTTLSFVQTTATVSGGLSAGSHSLHMDLITDDQDRGEHEMDVFGLFDDRFTYTFPDEVVPSPVNQGPDEDGYLDGPEELPNEAQAVGDIVSIENAIEAAELIVSADTGFNQEIGIEFGPDSGTAFSPDLVAANSQTLSGDTPGDLVSEIRAAVTLGHTDATRDTQSPRTGFESQSLTSWQLSIDEVSIVIFNEREFSGNWYQIIRDMHDEGALIFRDIPDENELKAETFERGALDADPVDWTRISFERGYENVLNYANKLKMVGGEDENGNYPVVTVQDDDEIARVGEEISDYEVADSRTTESGLRNLGQVELRKRTNDDLEGTVDIVPRPLKPGYRYLVPAFDDSWAVLERRTFQDGKQPNGTLEFEDAAEISRVIGKASR